MQPTIRSALVAALAGLALTACSKAEQEKATQDVKEAGDKVAAGVKEATHDIAKDEAVQAAANEVDKAADKAGEAAKVAAANASDAAAKAARSAALDAKAAVHKATEPTPEEKAETGQK